MKWVQDTENAVAQASGKPDACLKWMMKALDTTGSPEDLADSGEFTLADVRFHMALMEKLRSQNICQS